MGIKRVLATVLAATMLVGSAIGISADVTSPHGADIPVGTKKEVHSNSNVYYTGDTTTGQATALKVDVLKNPQGDGVELEHFNVIGDGKNPLIVGDGLTKVRIKKKSTVKKNAFKGTNIKYIILHKGVTFEKDSLNGTKSKVYITIKNLTAAKGLKAKGKCGGKNVVVKIKKKVYKKLSPKQRKSFNKTVKKLGATVKKI